LPIVLSPLLVEIQSHVDAVVAQLVLLSVSSSDDIEPDLAQIEGQF
jgi:hypothetical protein